MGKLVFQATLGGQVNLVGPNTASTYDINVPAVAGNMVTTGDTGTVTNTMCASSVYTAPGTIGSGTPNTGAFTTLSASSTTTLSGGTANSVAYLNGSKVVTTGSALQFDGTNLGLGVTPSAWATLKAASIGSTGSSVAGNSNGVYLTQSAYYNAGWKYSQTGVYAGLYQIVDNTHSWSIAGTGTAGNAISFTQAMTLDASGNLGVGTTSPSSAVGFTPRVQIAGSYPAYILQGTEASAKKWTIGETTGALAFYNDTDSAERMRLDTNGNLLVGTTTAGFTSGTGIKLRPAQDGSVSVTDTYSTNAATSYIMYSTGASNYRFYVDWGGTIHATSTSIAAISDATLKTNVKDLETGLTEVMALKPRRFDWINGDAANVAGFIAQEVEQVLPELVIESKYSVDEEGNDILKKNLKMGDILPTLVKAIQEQQALITQLQADVTALKAA